MKSERSDVQNLAKMADVFAEVGVMLLSHGASSSRTERNLSRIADAFGLRIEYDFSFLALTISVEEPLQNKKVVVVRRIHTYLINYSIISAISILSWEISGGKMSLQEIEDKLSVIKTARRTYPEWLKVIFIGIATGALSRIFGGNFVEFLVASLAGMAGIFVRDWILKRGYNLLMCIFIAAMVSTSTVNIFRHFGLEHYQGATAACVLWMTPGALLINGFLDVLTLHLISGWLRALFGFLILLVIGIGFSLSLFLFGYGSSV